MLNLVNNESIAMLKSAIEEIIYTNLDVRVLDLSEYVTIINNAPMNIRVIPSSIHSINSICLLSNDSEPKVAKIDSVINIWKIPSANNNVAEIVIVMTRIMIVLHFDKITTCFSIMLL